MKVATLYIFIFSLISSFLLTIPVFFVSSVNSDFFSFYYIGEGLTQGAHPYRDFSDNKGIVLYYFFEALYLIFKTNTVLALYFGIALVDGLTAFFLTLFLKNYFKVAPRVLLFSSFLALCMLKSGNLAVVTVSLSSESVGMLFIAASLYAISVNKDALSALLFMLAVFTRLTYAPFILLPLGILIPSSDLRRIVLYLVKNVVFGLGLFLVTYMVEGFTFKYIYENLFVYNKNYALLYQDYKIPIYANIMRSDWRFGAWFFGALVVFGVSIKRLLSENSKDALLIMAAWAVIVVSFLSTAQPHAANFIQLVPSILLIVSFFLFRTEPKRLAKILVGALFLLAIPLNYGLVMISGYLPLPYSRISKDAVRVLPDSVRDKKFVKVITNYSQIYSLLGKRAPDRYFQLFFLSRTFNNPTQDIADHKFLSEAIVKNTLFVAPVHEGSLFDSSILSEYLGDFRDSFGLSLHSIHQIDDGKVYVFVAD